MGRGRAMRPRKRGVVIAIAMRALRIMSRTPTKQGMLRPLLVAIIGLALAWIGAGRVVKATGYSAVNAAAIIASRSPGARADGVLTQIKLPRQRVASRSGERSNPHPGQRVLSEIRDHRPAPAGPPPISLSNTPALLPVTPAELMFANPIPAQFPPMFGGLEPSSSIFQLSPSPVSTAPGGVTSAASVPEPDIWSLLIIGVGTIGIMSRRRRRLSRMHSAV